METESYYPYKPGIIEEYHKKIKRILHTNEDNKTVYKNLLQDTANKVLRGNFIAP